MKFGFRTAQLTLALALMGIGSLPVLAQAGHSHTVNSNSTQDDPGALVLLVRQSTARFQDPSEAIAEGYKLQFGCVSGDTGGAMGMHFVNGDLVNSGVIDASRPQIVIYEPAADGKLKLIGADYLVLADTWNSSHAGPPQLMGQLFHLFDSPNRFGLPAFYTLHVWAWKDNPNGAFVNWHPNVSCTNFSGFHSQN